MIKQKSKPKEAISVKGQLTKGVTVNDKIKIVTKVRPFLQKRNYLLNPFQHENFVRLSSPVKK